MNCLRLLAIMTFWSMGVPTSIAQDYGLDLNQIQQEEEAAERPAESIRPADGKATLMYVSDGWAIWRISELIEETRHHRGQSFNHSIYLQQLTNPEAALVRTTVGGPGGTFLLVTGPGRPSPSGTITADGTLITISRNGVEWRKDGQQIAQIPRDQGTGRIYFDGVGVYADGVLVQRSSREPGPLRFIPFKDHQLDLENEVEVAPAGTKSFKYLEPLRHGSTFVWTTQDALQFYDLTTHTRWKKSVGFELGDDNYATAFDGNTVIVSGFIPFDAEDGTDVAPFKFSDGPSLGEHVGEPFGSGAVAVRNRIAYYIKDDWLSAVDLTAVPPRSVRLVKGPLRPIGDGAEGLHVWTGESWTFVPWLESVPPDGQVQAPEESATEVR